MWSIRLGDERDYCGDTHSPTEGRPTLHHRDAVLDGLATNPALPPDLLRRLLTDRRGARAVAGRPDLAPDVIEELLATDEYRVIHRLALNRHLPGPVRRRLAAHPDPSIRVAAILGGDQDAPMDFTRLIDDPDPEVRKELAQTGHLPPDLRARLATDPDPQVRVTLAEWWVEAPEAVRRGLLTDPADEVRAAACATYYRRLPHPVPPADLIPALLADPVTRVGAVRHATLDPGTARRLAEDPDDDVRREVALHPHLPADLRSRLAQDGCARVRVAVFSRPDTPEPTRARIHDEIIGRQAPITDMLDADDVELYLAAVELAQADLPWVTADPLPHVDSPYPAFRRAAARAAAVLPVAVVRRLLDDEEIDVRTTAARHAPHLVDLATAERLDREYRPSKKERWRPADTFAFPPATLRRFAGDPDPRMRCLAPRDPDLPPHLAARLAADPETAVRRAVAGHPRLPAAALVALTDDPNEHVARAAAASPGLPRAQMAHLVTLADR